MTKFYKDYLLPIGLLSGTIIGAGIFSLPFVFERSGVFLGFLYLMVAGAAYIAVHLMYADIILRTKQEKRFAGYAREYLGGWAFWLSMLTTLAQGILVLTIYLVLSVSFFSIILGAGSELPKILFFWFLASVSIFLSLKRLATLELWITGGIAAIILLIFISGLPGISAIDFFKLGRNAADWLLPLSPVLFALSGRAAIPAIVDYFKLNKESRDASNFRKLKSSIIWGTIFSAAVYGLFALGVISISPLVAEDAVSGLSGLVPNNIFLSIGFLGLLSLFSSYIVLGLDIKNTLDLDINTPKELTFAVVVFGPLAPYFLGFKNFIYLVSFAGGIFLSIEGLLVLAMFIRARKSAGPPVLFKKSPYFMMAVIAAVFSAALIYELIKYTKLI